jgi:hypothetical protein
VHEGGFGLRVTDDGLFVFFEPGGTRLAEAGRLDRHLQQCFSGNISADEAGDVAALYVSTASTA